MNMEKDNSSVKNILLNIEKDNINKLQDNIQENRKISDSGENEVVNTTNSFRIHKPKPIRPLIGKRFKYKKINKNVM